MNDTTIKLNRVSPMLYKVREFVKTIIVAHRCQSKKFDKIIKKIN